MVSSRTSCATEICVLSVSENRTGRSCLARVLWLLIFTIGWVLSLLAYLICSYALKYVKASKGSILSVLEPVSAALFSTVLLGESLEALQLVGIALALIGIVLLFERKVATTQTVLYLSYEIC